MKIYSYCLADYEDTISIFVFAENKQEADRIAAAEIGDTFYDEDMEQTEHDIQCGLVLDWCRPDVFKDNIG